MRLSFFTGVLAAIMAAEEVNGIRIGMDVPMAAVPSEYEEVLMMAEVGADAEKVSKVAKGAAPKLTTKAAPIGKPPVKNKDMLLDEGTRKLMAALEKDLKMAKVKAEQQSREQAAKRKRLDEKGQKDLADYKKQLIKQN